MHFVITIPQPLLLRRKPWQPPRHRCRIPGAAPTQMMHRPPRLRLMLHSPPHGEPARRRCRHPGETPTAVLHSPPRHQVVLHSPPRHQVVLHSPPSLHRPDLGPMHARFDVYQLRR